MCDGEQWLAAGGIRVEPCTTGGWGIFTSLRFGCIEPSTIRAAMYADWHPGWWCNYYVAKSPYRLEDIFIKI